MHHILTITFAALPLGCASDTRLRPASVYLSHDDLPENCERVGRSSARDGEMQSAPWQSGEPASSEAALAQLAQAAAQVGGNAVVVNASITMGTLGEAAPSVLQISGDVFQCPSLQGRAPTWPQLGNSPWSRSSGWTDLIPLGPVELTSDQISERLELSPESCAGLPSERLLLGLLVTAELPIVYDVVPGSPAASAGVEAHDEIIGIGARDTPSTGVFLEALAEVATAGEPLLLRTKRGDFSMVPYRPEISRCRWADGKSTADCRFHDGHVVNCRVVE